MCENFTKKENSAISTKLISSFVYLCNAQQNKLTVTDISIRKSTRSENYKSFQNEFAENG